MVRDLREQRTLTIAEELTDYGPACWPGSCWHERRLGWGDSTICNDANHLELIRDWFDRPLWEMQPTDADTYFGEVLRDAKPAPGPVGGR